MIPFDLLNSPLKGIHLIEASAGTGKTHTIAGLYVRLILEEAIPVREILVVTFTLAATPFCRHWSKTALTPLRNRLPWGICMQPSGISMKRPSSPFMASVSGCSMRMLSKAALSLIRNW